MNITTPETFIYNVNHHFQRSKLSVVGCVRRAQHRPQNFTHIMHGYSCKLLMLDSCVAVLYIRLLEFYKCVRNTFLQYDCKYSKLQCAQVRNIKPHHGQMKLTVHWQDYQQLRVIYSLKRSEFSCPQVGPVSIVPSVLLPSSQPVK